MKKSNKKRLHLVDMKGANLVLRTSNFLKYLEDELGIYSVNMNDSEHLVIKQDKLLTPVKPKEVRKLFWHKVRAEDFIEERIAIPGNFDHTHVKDLFAENKSFFSHDMLSHNYLNDVSFIEDSKHEIFFYYRNCAVKVTKDSITPIPYSELDGYVWGTQVIDRDFQLVNECFESDFGQFLANISSRPGIGGTRGFVQDAERLVLLCAQIGYMCHKFYNEKLKMVVWTDSSEEDRPEGRTGKGILGKAIGHVMGSTYVPIAGKDFRSKDKEKYSELDIDTKAVHLEDASKYLKIEDLFNDITEGLRIRKMHQDKFKIFAKILLSTNRSLRIQKGSGSDRTWLFQLAQYYSDEHSPADECNGRFFWSNEWEPKDWAAFDNIMMNCAQTWLDVGFMQGGEINIHSRIILDHTSQEFVDFLEHPDHGILRASKWEPLDEFPDFQFVKIMKRDTLIEYKSRHSIEDNKFNYRFGHWLKTYCEHHPDIISHTKANKKKYKLEYPSNSDQAFLFVRKKKVSNLKKAM